MRIGVLAALAAFFVSGCATVEEPMPELDIAKPAACTSPSDVRGSLPAPQRVEAHLRGTQAERFMQIYNAIPPRTTRVADELLVLSQPGVTTMAVLRFVGGCFKSFGIHPRKLTELILRRVQGEGT